jgi:hypothetical protein
MPTNHRGHELKFLKVNAPRPEREPRELREAGEIGIYIVTGRQAVAGVSRGHLVDLPADQAARLLKSGVIAKAPVADADPVDETPTETETPADNPVADETGHSPETVESE